MQKGFLGVVFILVASAFSVVASGSGTAALTLELSGPAELLPEARSATLVARPLGRVGSVEADLPAERRFELRWPGAHELTLASAIVWELRVEAEDFWDRPFTVSLSTDGAAPKVHRQLLPTGDLLGRFAAGPEKTPGSIQLRVRRSAPDEGVDEPELDVRAWDEATCMVDVDKASFRCAPPVGRYDLRLSVDGAVPHYLWGVTIDQQRPLDVGALRFVPGASLSGWVTAPATPGADPPQAVTVRLTPRLASGPGGEIATEERIAATGATATADDRGFFQLRGAPAGTYELVVAAPGFAPARIAPVHLVQGREAVLDEVIVLRTPTSLRVRVDPPLDPYGRQWHWELVRSDSRLGRLELSGRGRLDEEGEVVVGDLSPGPHLLTIEDEDGSRWLGREIDLGPEEETIPVELDVVVDGLLLLGDEPLMADVVFGSVFATTALRFESDDDGRFIGHLPHAGEWKVEVRDGETGSLLSAEPVEVEPDGGVAEVVLRLPDTRVAGRVLSESGEPVRDAVLLVMQSEKRRWGSQARSGEDGRFVLRGLKPAEYYVQARSRSAASDWVPVYVEEHREVSDLSLVLRESRVVTGRLTSGGAPVPGAMVQAVPQRRMLAPQRVAQARTDVEGRFQVEVPADSALVDLLVSPPGLPFLARRVHLGGAPERVDLEVDRRGGRLELVGAAPRTDRSDPPDAVLLVDGIPVHLSQLRDRWQVRDDGGALILAPMEPGSYALCPVEALISTSGQHGVDPACATGILPPLGSLRLGIVNPDRKESAP